MIVNSEHEVFDEIRFSDGTTLTWEESVSRDFQEADYMNLWHDNFDDYDASNAY